MKQKKCRFFTRLKNAITNFDDYKIYVEENLSVAIKYVLKLVIIFTIILTIALTIKVSNEANKFIQIFKEECPEFKFENNNLIIEEENKRFTKGDEANFFSVTIDSEKENLADIEQVKDYQRVVAVLKDKVVLKDAQNVETSITYEQLSQQYDMSSINKQSILEFITGNNMIKIYIIFIIICIIYLFILYLIQIALDILFLSVVGFLLSKVVGINIKYKSALSMSAYAISLSVLLYLIYTIVNLFTGFEVKYFEMAYYAIAYIYIITAMLMMKSDLTKTKIELTKIIQEQRKIREEINSKDEEQNKDDSERQNKKEQEEKKKNNEKKDKKGEKGTPEGNHA